MQTVETKERPITILVYEDLAEMHEWLVRVFGFESGGVERDDDGKGFHAELRVGDGTIWLHRVAPEHGLVSARTVGAATASLAVLVPDVDEHYRGVVERGGHVASEPADQAYGYREYNVRDPEGVLWSFMAPLR
jgi:uncharacterized glyoxalase superfamily protein PhnB